MVHVTGRHRNGLTSVKHHLTTDVFDVLQQLASQASDLPIRYHVLLVGGAERFAEFVNLCNVAVFITLHNSENLRFRLNKALNAKQATLANSGSTLFVNLVRVANNDALVTGGQAPILKSEELVQGLALARRNDAQVVPDFRVLGV